MQIDFIEFRILDLRSLASFRVVTRQKLAMLADELTDDGVISKVKSEGGYRNAILISGIYRHVRTKDVRENVHMGLATAA